MDAIEINQLTKTYRNGTQAVKSLDLTIQSGDFFALLGANGAGKSTTIGMITTLLNKSGGTIKIQGHDLDKAPSKAKACIGLVPQEINLNIFETCEQILLSQAGYYGITRKQALNDAHLLLHELGLWEKKDTIVRHLSGGMKRRLMIARALVHKPCVLILDEPTAGVDIEIRRSIWQFLTRKNKEGVTIVLTTHYLEEAEQLCRNIAIIDQGRLITHSSMKQLLATFRHQTYVLTTADTLTELPDLAPFYAKLIDANTFELQVDNRVHLNEIFQMLTKHRLFIQSMRNKTNRLEELFLDLIHYAQ
ncbi:MAG: ABC transporter [Legionellaceae bacterium]|nr:ABC transporter [Legionellaceae bacterium]HAF87033.1 ABC transporter [Legionellales bacterium]HCA89994.1 ABC transporter [Legionellales bacterium]|tara:strand:- start:362 stop:1276 length:915 start_codon:yes stop_codon:yes gene_type:complete